MPKPNVAAVAIACVATPIVFSWVTSSWRSLVSPFRGEVGRSSFFASLSQELLIEFLGACLAAVILSVALSWFVRGRAYFVAIVLSVSATLSLLPSAWFAAHFWRLYGHTASFRVVLLELPTLALFAVACFGIAVAQSKVRREST